MKLITIILCSILFIEQNFFNLLLLQTNRELIVNSNYSQSQILS